MYRHEEKKTKHAYFQEIIKECRHKYASKENLKFLRNQEVGFLVGLETNHIVKQECHAQHFFVRQTKAIENHLFWVLRVYHRLIYLDKKSI